MNKLAKLIQETFTNYKVRYGDHFVLIQFEDGSSFVTEDTGLVEDEHQLLEACHAREATRRRSLQSEVSA